MSVKEKQDAVKRLTAEQQELVDQLGIKTTTGRQIAALSGRQGKVPESELERAGILRRGAAGEIAQHAFGIVAGAEGD